MEDEPKILTKPLPEILEEMEKNIKAATEAATKAEQAAHDARIAEESATEAATQATSRAEEATLAAREAAEVAKRTSEEAAKEASRKAEQAAKEARKAEETAITGDEFPLGDVVFRMSHETRGRLSTPHDTGQGRELHPTRRFPGVITVDRHHSVTRREHRGDTLTTTTRGHGIVHQAVKIIVVYALT